MLKYGGLPLKMFWSIPWLSGPLSGEEIQPGPVKYMGPDFFVLGPDNLVII